MDIDIQALELIYPCISKSPVEHILILSMGKPHEWGFYNAKTGFILDPINTTYTTIRDKFYMAYGTSPFKNSNTVDLYLEARNELLHFQGTDIDSDIYTLNTYEYVSIFNEGETILYNTETGEEVFRGKIVDKKLSSINSPIVVSFRGNNGKVYGISKSGAFGLVADLLASEYLTVTPFKIGSTRKLKLETHDNKEIIVDECGQFFGI